MRSFNLLTERKSSLLQQTRAKTPRTAVTLPLALRTRLCGLLRSLSRPHSRLRMKSISRWCSAQSCGEFLVTPAARDGRSVASAVVPTRPLPAVCTTSEIRLPPIPESSNDPRVVSGIRTNVHSAVFFDPHFDAFRQPVKAASHVRQPDTRHLRPVRRVQAGSPIMPRSPPRPATLANGARRIPDQPADSGHSGVKSQPASRLLGSPPAPRPLVLLPRTALPRRPAAVAA